MWRCRKCLQRPVRSTQGGRLSQRNAFPCCVNGMCQGVKTPALSWLSRGCRGPFPLCPDHLHGSNTTMRSIVNKTRRFAIATVSECGTALVLFLRMEKDHKETFLMNMFRDFFIPLGLVLESAGWRFYLPSPSFLRFVRTRFVEKLGTHWGVRGWDYILGCGGNGILEYIRSKLLMVSRTL